MWQGQDPEEKDQRVLIIGILSTIVLVVCQLQVAISVCGIGAEAVRLQCAIDRELERHQCNAPTGLVVFVPRITCA